MVQIIIPICRFYLRSCYFKLFHIPKANGRSIPPPSFRVPSLNQGFQLSRGELVWGGITSFVATPHTVPTSSKGSKIVGAPLPPPSNEAQLNYRASDTPLERHCLPQVLLHSPGLVTDFFAWRAAEKEGEKTNFTSLNTHYLINVVTSSYNILKVGLSTCSTQPEVI